MRMPVTVGAEETTQQLLMYFVVPVWLAAGLADWYQRRRTHIETTSGAQESMIHLLMLARLAWRCLRARPTLAPQPEPAQVVPVSSAHLDTSTAR